MEEECQFKVVCIVPKKGRGDPLEKGGFLPENTCQVCMREIPLSEWNTKPIVMCPVCGNLINRLETIENESELYAPIPDIALTWVRFQEHISFATKAKSWLALGIRGSGKSSILENLSIRYPKIIDLYGSSDLEALCW